MQRKIIYSSLTALEKAMVQWAHDRTRAPKNMNDAFIRYCDETDSRRHILQWAMARGDNWSDEVCVYAALIGNIELLEWARANGSLQS